MLYGFGAVFLDLLVRSQVGPHVPATTPALKASHLEMGRHKQAAAKARRREKSAGRQPKRKKRK